MCPIWLLSLTGQHQKMQLQIISIKFSSRDLTLSSHLYVPLFSNKFLLKYVIRGSFLLASRLRE